MRVSKALYLGSIIGAPVLGIIILIVGVIGLALTPTLEAGLPAFSLAVGLAIALFIYAIVMELVLLYKAWKVIQDGSARTSPGKAIGFLFIPFFNFYWIFQAFWGFAKDYNAYVQRHHAASAGGISIPVLSVNLFLAYCILSLVAGLLSSIPFIGFLFVIAYFVLFVMVIIKLCDAINNLPVDSGITSAQQTS
jgi:hypothetical protein